MERSRDKIIQKLFTYKTKKIQLFSVIIKWYNTNPPSFSFLTIGFVPKSLKGFFYRENVG